MSRSTFTAPNYTPDQFATLFDLPANQLANAQRYQDLRLRKASLTEAESAEFATLTNILRDYLITPERWNHFQDALMSMQFFIRDKVDGYVQTFQAEVDKLTTRGEYNPATQYYKKNIVTLQQQGFICLEDTVGFSPTLNASNARWGLISGQGPQGPQGNPGLNGTNQVFKGAWSAAASYLVTDLVQYQGNTFSCVQAHTNQIPVDNGVYWRMFLEKGQSVLLTSFKNTVTLGTSSVNVPIGIAQYNHVDDVLMVYVTGAYAEREIVWTLNANNTSIDKKSGSWASGTVINFVVLKNMQTTLLYTDGTMLQNGTVGDAKLVTGSIAENKLAAWWTTYKTGIQTQFTTLQADIVAAKKYQA